MLLDEDIPNLSDKELEALHANAIRLAQSGAAKQQAEAERLLPIVGAVVEERRAERARALAEKRALNKRKTPVAGRAASK